MPRFVGQHSLDARRHDLTAALPWADGGPPFIGMVERYAARRHDRAERPPTTRQIRASVAPTTRLVRMLGDWLLDAEDRRSRQGLDLADQSRRSV